METDIITLQNMKERVLQLWAPPPRLTVSQWAANNRVLPKGTSVRPGPWRSEPYQIEMMDAMCNPDVREVVNMKATQTGYSDGVLNNTIGYFIDSDPKPMMMVQPIDDAAKDYVVKRINPMISACDCLKDRVKDSANYQKMGSQRLKIFDGGFLKIAGANSAASLRSDPVEILLLDEIDGYEDDVQGEGDPIDIAMRRTDTYASAKVFKGSTPGKPKGVSRIEAAYELSSQGRYFVPCPSCGQLQVLCWRGKYQPTADGNSYIFIEAQEGVYNMIYTLDERGDVIASSVKYLCCGCGYQIDEKYKQKMMTQGRWIHRYPQRVAVRGFHIWAAYSPWKLLWPDLCNEWHRAQGNIERLKTFINLRLGETWNEGAEVAGVEVLRDRAHDYKNSKGITIDVPNGVGVLIGAADVQHNRVEAVVIGFGDGEESWVIDHGIFYGDPGVQSGDSTDVWVQLDNFFMKGWLHESGQQVKLSLALVDAGDGGHADSVYDYVLPRQGPRRIFACKGVEFLSRPVLAQAATAKRGNVKLWTIATSIIKDRIMARMKIAKDGKGAMHFPDWITDEYLSQLTSEKKIGVRDKRTRTTKYHYVKVHNRNEALDMTVYCYGGLFILQRHIDPRYLNLEAMARALTEGQAPMPPRRRMRFSGV